MKLFLILLSGLLFVAALFFGMWAIQAMWLSSFPVGRSTYDYSAAFYVRSICAVLSLVGSVIAARRARRRKAQ